MTFLDQFAESLYTGDPLIRTWFLVGHDLWPLVLCSSYAAFVTLIGPRIMRNREPLDLRKTMIFYNFLIVVTYTVAVSYVFTHLHLITKDEFCYGTLVRKGHPSYMLARMAWVIYLLKYVEFGDTVFFVLRKKDHLITNLHLIHHTLLPMFAWIMLRTESSGIQSIPVMINSVVHIVMYFYYGLAAMGPHMKKYLWWKKHLTIFQMGQFVLIFLFIVVLTPMTNCTLMKASIVVDMFCAVVFFSLFFNFYQKTFSSKAQIAKSS